MKAQKTSDEMWKRALRLHRSGQTKEAESLYRKLIFRNVQNHRALSSLGLLLFEAGRIGESSPFLERAIAVHPEPKYLTILGEVYRRQGRLDVAAETFGRILETDPDFPEARLNLAITLAEAGVDGDALTLLEEALQVGPDSPRLRVALAALLLTLHRPEHSLIHAGRAVELAPNAASTHRQLGDALDACDEKAAAIASYRRAIELDPSDCSAHSDLIIAMLSTPGYDAQTLFAEARAWAQRHAEPLREHLRPHSNDKNPERQLRLGYVSPDFRAHAIQQFMVPLLEHHEKSEFEIFLYSSARRSDSRTKWYQGFAGDHFRDIRNLGDIEAAELIRRDGIDILIDLALHSVGGRLRIFACRPAPVQVTWLGYPGTTGLDTVDYRITDPFVDPPGTDLSVYSETSLHLPETLWCYSALTSELEVGPLPALSTGCITFACQNSYRKLHGGVIALWSRVLRGVSGARLFLHAEEDRRERIYRAFAAEGISRDRIELGGRIGRIDYLRRYQRIDIGLDTFPFHGATTTLDAAWMGVPVITLSGPSSLQRAGACIAANLGLSDLIADSEDQFVDIAIGLARDIDRLRKLRAGLRARLESSPLGDAPRFARNLEAAFRRAWRRYCARSP